MIPPTADSYRLAALTAADAGALAQFRCARLSEPWSLAVESYLRSGLVPELTGGYVQALGLWDGDGLVAVIVYRLEPNFPTLCRCFYLATAVGNRGRGCARRLKSRLCEVAWSEGRTAITSRVHRDNNAMLRVNLRLGAEIGEVEEDDHRLCIISRRE